jgi:hypothetical protein
MRLQKSCQTQWRLTPCRLHTASGRILRTQISGGVHALAGHAAAGSAGRHPPAKKYVYYCALTLLLAGHGHCAEEIVTGWQRPNGSVGLVNVLAAPKPGTGPRFEASHTRSVPTRCPVQQRPGFL